MLHAYASGVFPMAETSDSDELFWVNPIMRGVFPLDGFHISRSLAKRMRNTEMTVTLSRAFASVVEGCAAREETWINQELTELYASLHRLNRAHSVEVWEGDELVGGVFGLTIGGAFFGESMFSTRTDASKLALAALVDRLRAWGFALFDTQFITPHLASLGAEEIPRSAYQAQLAEAIPLPVRFKSEEGTVPLYQVWQRSTQTS